MAIPIPNKMVFISNQGPAMKNHHANQVLAWWHQPLLTNNQWCFVALISEQFDKSSWIQHASHVQRLDFKYNRIIKIEI